MAEAKTPDEQGPCEEIYYFGYGPIVNDMVRQRREIETSEIQAAYVSEYRLTFAFGGNANIVKKVGFQVHGLLMKLKSPADWEKIKKFEAGNEPQVRTVVPYSAMAAQQNQSDNDNDIDDIDNDNDNDNDEDSHNADEDFFAPQLKGTIQAYLIEMPGNVEDTLLDAPIERLPQERYLKLIAQGMRQHGVDEDYVTDHIEACPFIPSRTPSEYFTFPVAKKVPIISFMHYQKLCDRAKVEEDVYFCLGRRVFRLGEHDAANPLAKWFEAHGHGKPCCTYMTHLTVVDPNIPLLHDAKDVTPLHIAWAENHLVEVIQQYGMSATRVYELAELAQPASKDTEALSNNSSQTKSCWHWIIWPLRSKKKMKRRATDIPQL
jgi:hypothetical protein